MQSTCQIHVAHEAFFSKQAHYVPSKENTAGRGCSAHQLLNAGWDCAAKVYVSFFKM